MSSDDRYSTTTTTLNLSIRFQWVKCQLNALGRCLSLYDLRGALRSLPKDLDDTYARILQSIDDNGFGKPVAKIMQCLAYSAPPMFLTELVEVLTIDVEGDPQVNVERRLVEPDDLLTMCSDLVSTVHQPMSWDEQKYIIANRGWKPTLQFAHFSVREYLGSSRLHDGPGKRFALHETLAHAFMAKTCIIYLGHFNALPVIPPSLDEYPMTRFKEEFPLVEYAAMDWPYHAERAEEDEEIPALCEEFLLSKGNALSIWTKMFHYGAEETVYARGKGRSLYYASSFNLPKTVARLISKGVDVNLKFHLDWTVLMTASSRRNEVVEVVQVLLEHGAEVNAQNHEGASGLWWASFNGHVQVVQLLLDNGAELDTQNQWGETALSCASGRGNAAVVRRLLDGGASINSPYGETALYFASCSGHYEVSQMLLAQGVDVNAENTSFPPLRQDPPKWVYKTALMEILERGHFKCAELLLEYGADVNAQSSTVDGKHGIALEHALNHDDLYDDDFYYEGSEMLQFLLGHGADSRLIRTQNLSERGMRCYERMLSLIETQRR